MVEGSAAPATTERTTVSDTVFTRVAEDPRAHLEQTALSPAPSAPVRFLRFATVGGIGYVANVTVFAALVGIAEAPYLAAAVASFTVAVVLNYLLNRAWTFRDAQGGFVRFGAVSVVALGFNLIWLHLLVGLGLDQVASQSLAIALALPVSYAGNRLWAFRTVTHVAPAAPTCVHVPAGVPEVVATAICIPTYDERENLEPMLRALGRVLGPNDVVLVLDDNSPDGTGELADRLADELGNVIVLHRPGKQGLGRAYVEGFDHALDLGAEVVVEMDCDFSHDPADVPRLVAAAAEGGVALGSRYVRGGSADGLSRPRRVVSRLGSLYARLVLGVAVRDLTGGFKAYRRDALEALRIHEVESNGYCFQVETTYRAALAGFAPVEVPIAFHDRAGGSSKMSAGIAAEALWRVPTLRIDALARAWTVERAEAYRAVMLWWALSRAVVFVTVGAVQLLGWPRRSWYPPLAHHPFALLGAWDGRWYRMVAERGYLAVPHRQSDTAFFPGYPILVRTLHALTGLSVNTAGIVLANVGLLVALVALYELVRTWLPHDTAVRTAAYAAIFPAGYVFSMVYPESLVLAAIALAGVFAVRGRWTAAAVAASLAALGREEAVFLVVPLGVLVWRRWRDLDDGRRWRALVATFAAPAAVAGLVLNDLRLFGDPVAFSTAQRAWGRWLSLDGALRAWHELMRSSATGNEWLFRDASLCAVYVVLLVIALRAGVPRAWVLAGAFIVLLPLETGSFTSDARFGLLAPAAYAGLAVLARRRWLDVLLRVSSLSLLVAASATILMRWP